MAVLGQMFWFFSEDKVLPEVISVLGCVNVRIFSHLLLRAPLRGVCGGASGFELRGVVVSGFEWLERAGWGRSKNLCFAFQSGVTNDTLQSVPVTCNLIPVEDKPPKNRFIKKSEIKVANQKHSHYSDCHLLHIRSHRDYNIHPLARQGTH